MFRPLCTRDGLFSMGTEGRPLSWGPLAALVDIESSGRSLWDVLSGVRPGSWMEVRGFSDPTPCFTPGPCAFLRRCHHHHQAWRCFFCVFLESYLVLLWLLQVARPPLSAYWSIYANTCGHYHYRLFNRTSLRLRHARQREVAMDTWALKYSIL